MPKLTVSFVEALVAGEHDRIIWDTELKGFGVRVSPGGSRSFLVQYRNAECQTRRMVLGKYPVLTPEKARKLALKQLGVAASGEDPSVVRRAARGGVTVGEICDWYLEEAMAGRLLSRRRTPMKVSSIKNDRTRIEDHIRPLLGTRKVKAMTLGDVERFQADVAAGKTKKSVKRKGRGATTKGGSGVAGRTIATLRAMFSHALRWELIERNPALGVRQMPIGKRDRRLTEEEIVALGGEMVRAAERGEAPAGLAGVEMLLVTGFRRSEGLGLRKEWVSGPTVRFPDTKTGAQNRIIGRAARELVAFQGQGATAGYVFPSDRGDGPVVAIERVLKRLCAAAGIEGVTPHTLRHTFATMAAELGYAELTIGALLGHASHGVTQRYVHVDKILVAAADQTSLHIQALLAREAGLWRPQVDLLEQDEVGVAAPPPMALRSEPEVKASAPTTAKASVGPEAIGFGTANALFGAMVSAGKAPSDLVSLLGGPSATELLGGMRDISMPELRTLCAEWKVAPTAFL